MVAAGLGFKRRAAAALKSDLIRSIKSDTVVARCLAFTNFLYVPSRGSCFQPPKWLIGNLILNLWEESLFKKKEERKKCNQTRRTKEWIIPSQRRHVLQTPRVHQAVYTRELSREEFSNFFSWKNHPNYSAQLNSFFLRGASCAV